jgi:hypothetical protein
MVVAEFICSDCQLATAISAGQAGVIPRSAGVASWLSKQSIIEAYPAVPAQEPTHKITICGCRVTQFVVVLNVIPREDGGLGR